MATSASIGAVRRTVAEARVRSGVVSLVFGGKPCVGGYGGAGDANEHLTTTSDIACDNEAAPGLPKARGGFATAPSAT